jgi:hypothetical protein
MVRTGILIIPGAIYNSPKGVYKSLHEIWVSRILRRIVSLLLMTPLQKSTLRIVNFPPPVEGGCVITSCHSPWIRILSLWCQSSSFAIMIVSGAWIIRRKQICKNGKGFSELRQIINHLRNGGRVIIAGDVLIGSKTCAASFFEKDCQVSLTPVRLARIAGVPIVAAFTKIENGRLNIRTGIQYDLQIIKANPDNVMQKILRFIENEIKKSPSVWTDFVRKPLSRVA